MTLPLYTEEVALGDDVVTTFEYGFPVNSIDDLEVYLEDIATGIVVLVDPNDYTVDLLAGSVTFSTVPTTGQKVIILSAYDYDQATTLENQSGYFPRVVESALDRVDRQLQQIAKDVARSIRGAPGETFTRFDAAPARANRYVKFDAAGQPTLAPLVAGDGTPSAYFFQNLDTAALATIPLGITIVQIEAFSATTPACAATYTRVNAAPTHVCKFRSMDRYLADAVTVDLTNGGWWEISGNSVNPLQAGAMGTVGVDDSDAVENAFLVMKGRGIGQMWFSRRHEIQTPAAVSIGNHNTYDFFGFGRTTGLICKTSSGQPALSITCSNRESPITFSNMAFEPGAAGCGNLLTLVYLPGGSQDKSIVMLDQVYFTPLDNSTAFYSEQPVAITGVKRLRVNRCEVAPGGAATGKATYQFNLTDCYQPIFTHNRIVGRCGTVIFVNNLQHTEGFAGWLNFLVGGDIGVDIQRVTGREPYIDWHHNHVNSRWKNFVVRGAKKAVIQSNLFYCNNDYIATYTYVGTAVTVTWNEDHHLAVGRLVQLSFPIYKSGAYTRAGTLVTVQITAHGFSTSDQYSFDFTSGDCNTNPAGIDGNFTITVDDADHFHFTHGSSGATSGSVDVYPRNDILAVATVISSKIFTLVATHPAHASGILTHNYVEGDFFDVDLWDAAEFEIVNNDWQASYTRWRRHVNCLINGGNSETAWAALTAYALGDRVSQAGAIYRAKIAHTSTASFSTDLANGLWSVVAVNDVVVKGGIYGANSSIPPIYIGPRVNRAEVLIPRYTRKSIDSATDEDNAGYLTTKCMWEVDPAALNVDCQLTDPRQTIAVTTGTDAASAVEKTLAEIKIPGGMLYASGKALQWRARGQSGNNDNVKGLKVKMGAAAVLTRNMTVSIAGIWEAWGTFQSSGVDTQKYWTSVIDNGAAVCYVGTGTEDDGAEMSCQVTGTITAGGGAIAANDLTCEFFEVVAK